jgi:hypothetical protein
VEFRGGELLLVLRRKNVGVKVDDHRSSSTLWPSIDLRAQITAIVSQGEDEGWVRLAH